ncbi:MAG: hypothetical protein Q4P36_04265 [Bowdeniella nasicola]|nr:hypothetical protein [Bowdeniella nasicola]
MNRRLVSIILAALGAILIVSAGLSATVFKESDRVTASLPTEPSAPAMVVDAGALTLLDSTVTVTAQADADLIYLAIAPLEEIDAWLGEESSVEEVDGLSDWSTLSVTTRQVAEGQPAPLPNPQLAELFLEVRTAPESVEWSITDPDHQMALLAVTDGTAPAPSLTLSWSRKPAPTLLWPLLTAGLVCLVAAALVWWWPHRRRVVRPHDEETQVIYVPALSPQEAEGLTRREIRERERERERAALEAARREGKRNVTVATSATIPVITDPIAQQNPERLIETAMLAGALVLPFSPNAERLRGAPLEDERSTDASEKWAPQGPTQAASEPEARDGGHDPDSASDADAPETSARQEESDEEAATGAEDPAPSPERDGAFAPGTEASDGAAPAAAGESPASEPDGDQPDVSAGPDEDEQRFSGGAPSLAAPSEEYWPDTDSPEPAGPADGDADGPEPHPGTEPRDAVVNTDVQLWPESDGEPAEDWREAWDFPAERPQEGEDR